MHRKAAIAACLLCLVAGSAYAGKPPMFKPDMPTNWTWQQKQIADKAIDVLLDKCPAVGEYLQHDVKGADVFLDRMSELLNSGTEPPFWKKNGWSNVLRLELVTIQKPQSPVLSAFAGRKSAVITFYMGTGTRPGIYFESGDRALCGAPDSVAVLRKGMASMHIPDTHDTFVPAKGLEPLDQF